MKQLHFTILFSTFLAVAAFAQPANDECSTAISLGQAPFCSQNGQFTNVGATASTIDVPSQNVPPCFIAGLGGEDVWFKFSLPNDGSIVDIEVNVFGNVQGQGTMQQPQVALYRGSCAFGDLAELACGSAPLLSSQATLTALGLTPGLTYFLRVNDWSLLGNNAGTFRLCVEKYIPDVIMGQSIGTSSCSGILYDSGGPTGDYSNGENLTFSICPQDFHQCIKFNIENYSIEENYDFLRFYAGPSAAALEISSATGFGNNFEVQISSNCATVGFKSDAELTELGFKLTWECTAAGCTVDPPTTCADPATVPSVPFSATNLSNCSSGNAIPGSPCSNDEFLNGNDYLFSYTSTGDECIRVSVQGEVGIGVGVYSLCPSDPAAECLAENSNGANPILSAVYLEQPGQYWIAVGSSPFCGDFDILIDTLTCPVTLPSAGFCADALNIGGCSTLQPEILELQQGGGDVNFLNNANSGCFADPQFNYTFFYFQAQADGTFAFSVQAADPGEASDIDFSIWGPIDSYPGICGFAENNQPVRSSWSPGDISTGLATINPNTGDPVTDNFDCFSLSTPGPDGDDYVKPLQVQKGKFYLVLLDDYTGNITNGGIAVDFSGTSAGVFAPQDSLLGTSADTSICKGQSIQLEAFGGAAYQWSPGAGLSCQNCSKPTATPTETTIYQVQIVGTCKTVERDVAVKIFDLDLGPDATVCNGASFLLNPNFDFANAQMVWTGPTQLLSCSNCPQPTFSAAGAGVFEFIATLTTPDCTLKDTLKITVLQQPAPVYSIAEDDKICKGETVAIGGPLVAGQTYAWTSQPTGLVSSASNPTVTPAVTTEYFLTVSNGSCPIARNDSVTIEVFETPETNVSPAQAICLGDSVLLNNSVEQVGANYLWSPAAGLSDPKAVNPMASPSATTNYLLTVQNEGCTITKTVAVEVTQIAISINGPDTIALCAGEKAVISAAVLPVGQAIAWSPNDATLSNPAINSIDAKPFESQVYYATVVVGNCLRRDSVLVKVDSLPADRGILPRDTTICLGNQVLLKSTTFEPSFFPDLDHLWSPNSNQAVFLTPDTLWNLLVQPIETTVYKRTLTNGGCTAVDSATVTVIQPAVMTINPPVSNVCGGIPVQLTITLPPGATDLEIDAPGATSSCSNCTNPIIQATSTTVITATADNMGCPIMATATIIVTPPPPIIVTPDAVDVCINEPVQLTITPPAGATGLTVTSAGAQLSCSNCLNPTVTTAESAQISVTATVGGCITNGYAQINVKKPTFSWPSENGLCLGESISLNASPNANDSYSFTSSDPAFMPTTALNPSVTPMLPLTTYFVDATIQGCPVKSEWTLQTFESPVAVSADVTICPGATTILTASGQIDGSFTWTDGEVDTNTKNSSNDVTPSQSTTYAVVYEYGPGCKKSDSVRVTVLPMFPLSISILPNRDSFSLGETYVLTANFGSTNTTGWTFEWRENNAPIAGATGPKVTVEAPAGIDLANYTVFATSPQNCQQTAELPIKLVQPEWKIPNAFTPDGDKLNDTFRIFVAAGEVLTERVQIWNRWGQLVFEGPDGWDGMLKNGKPAAPDVYVYRLNLRLADESLRIESGDLTLIR